MNSNSSLWIGIVVIVIVILGGVWLYNRDVTDSSPTATSTPTGTTGGGTNTGSSVGRAPVATTAALASPTSSTTVVVSGTVMPGGLPSTFWFEYGTTTSFGMVVPAKSVEAVQNDVALAAYLVNLTPGKQYYFRIGARNSKGISYGGVQSFITPAK